jgi:hypothetical protein
MVNSDPVITHRKRLGCRYNTIETNISARTLTASGAMKKFGPHANDIIP